MNLHELADALDEQWTMLADIQAEVEALRDALVKRDETMRGLIQHCARLVDEKEDLMRAMGIYGLVLRANREASQELKP